MHRLRTQRRSKQSDLRLKKEMTAVLTHDLRNPLASLSYLLQNLTLGSYGDVDAEAVKPLERANTNVLGLIESRNLMLEADKIGIRNDDSESNIFRLHHTYSAMYLRAS